MKRLILASSAVALMMTPAIAGGATEKPNAATTTETRASEHPPTNRVDKSVPTMTQKTDKKEHAPTNRMGKAVPDMTGDGKQGSGGQKSGSAKHTDKDGMKKSEMDNKDTSGKSAQ